MAVRVVFYSPIIFFMLFRQDAVMQQVFGLMNNLLATAALGPKSTNNKLNIRTFKVVPLSQRSGNFYMNLLVTIITFLYLMIIRQSFRNDSSQLSNEQDGYKNSGGKISGTTKVQCL